MFDAIREERFYILTHPEVKREVQMRIVIGFQIEYILYSAGKPGLDYAASRKEINL